MTRSAAAACAELRSSFTLPRPSRVAGSGCGDLWSREPTMRAPAPTANSRSSRSESSASGLPGILPEYSEGSQPARKAFSDVRARRILLPLQWRGPGNTSGARQHHGGDGVLENQLFLVVALQDQTILIKTADATGELDTTREIDRDQKFFLTRGIQKPILDILRRLLHFFLFSDTDPIIPCLDLEFEA